MADVELFWVDNLPLAGIGSQLVEAVLAQRRLFGKADGKHAAGPRAWVCTLPSAGGGVLPVLAQDLDGDGRRLALLPLETVFPFIGDLARSRQLLRSRSRHLELGSFYLLLDASFAILAVEGALPEALTAEAVASALSVKAGRASGSDVSGEMTVNGRVLHFRLSPAPEAALQVFLRDLTDTLEREDGVRQRMEALEVSARHDPLTGLLNRAGLIDGLERQLAFHRRYQRQGALLYIDLDNFKAVNDLRGHAGGDAALVAVSALLRGILRETDLASRIGGDEFVAWLNEIDREQAIGKAEEILAAAGGLNAEFGVPEKPLGFSIGVTMLDDHVSVQSLLNAADDRMYMAKKTGKARVVA